MESEYEGLLAVLSQSAKDFFYDFRNSIITFLEVKEQDVTEIGCLKMDSISGLFSLNYKASI